MSEVFASGQIISSGGALLLLASEISRNMGITTFDGVTLAPISARQPASLSEKEWGELKYALDHGFACDGDFALAVGQGGALELVSGNWIMLRVIRDGRPSEVLPDDRRLMLGAVLDISAHVSSGQARDWPVVFVWDADLPASEQTGLALSLMAEHDRLRVAAPDGRFVDIGHDRGTLVLHMHDGLPHALEPLIANMPGRGPITIEEYAYRAEREAVLTE